MGADTEDDEPPLVRTSSGVGAQMSAKNPTVAEIDAGVYSAIMQLAKFAKLPAYNAFVWENNASPAQVDMIWHEVKKAHGTWSLQTRHVSSALQRLHSKEMENRRRQIAAEKEVAAQRRERDAVALQAKIQEKNRASCQERAVRLFGLRRALLALLDVTTDIAAVVTYFRHGHTMWGILASAFLLGGIAFLPLILYTSAFIAVS